MELEKLNRSFLLFTILILVTITSLSYIQTRKNILSADISYLQISKDIPRYPCRGILANDTITPIQGSKAFVIAAYFDNRINRRGATRVISIVHHKDVKQMYCWFCCARHSNVQIIKAVIDIHTDRFGFPYGATDLYCKERRACRPKFVSIHGSAKGTVDQLPLFEIKNRKAIKSSTGFTVCISPVYGEYNNVLQFLQSVEMYKILGADKVMIYKNNCSQLMEKVLDLYVEEGTIEIIPWPIDLYLNVSDNWYYLKDDTSKEIGYYGQIAALNDCIYRNMYKTRYVILIDVDEIILPVKYWDWKTMMQALQKRHPRSGIFLFENHIFPNTASTPISQVNISSWSKVPGFNILEHILREPDNKDVVNPTKMIVDPTKVVHTSVHSVLRSLGGIFKVPIDVALVYHCRDSMQIEVPWDGLIEDTTIWRYNDTLIKNVNKVLERTVFAKE